MDLEGGSGSYETSCHQFSLDVDHLSCPVCLEVYEEPKALPTCAHNVCYTCLQQMVDKCCKNPVVVTCPICRATSTVPSGGMFPTNYFLKSIIDKIPYRKDKAELRKAVGRCRERLDSKRKIAFDNFDVLSTAVTNREGIFSSHIDNVKQKIQDRANHVIQLIRNQQLKLFSELDGIVREKTKSCQAKLHKIQKKFISSDEAAMAVLSSVEGQLEDCKFSEIAHQKDQMLANLNKLVLDFDVSDLRCLLGDVLSFKNVNLRSISLHENYLGTIANEEHDGLSLDPSGVKSSKKVLFANMEKSIDSDCLYNTFCNVGKVVSCETAVDLYDRPLGYGLVEFEKEEHAAHVVSKTNGKLFNDQKVSVGRFKPRTESLKTWESPTSTISTNSIYVITVGYILTNMILREANTGKTTSIDTITSTASGTVAGLSFVSLESSEEAEKAVDILNKIHLQVDGISTRAGKLKKEGHANVYVANMENWNFDETRLRKDFSAYGTVNDVKIIQNKNGTSTKGLLSFNSEEEAIDAAANMNGRMMYRSSLEVLYIGLSEGKTLSIKKLANDVDKHYLKTFFSDFGTVTCIKIKRARDEDGILKGFGFVTFSTQEEAVTAVSNMDDWVLNTNSFQVTIRQTKEELQLQKAAEFSRCRSSFLLPHPETLSKT